MRRFLLSSERLLSDFITNYSLNGTQPTIYQRVQGAWSTELFDSGKSFEKINPVDLQFVFRFACGLNKKAFSRIIKYLKGIKDGQSFAIRCFPEQVSEPDDELAIVKALLTGGVTIRSTDSRFLQRSTIQILDIAAKSNPRHNWAATMDAPILFGNPQQISSCIFFQFNLLLILAANMH
ncbi:hypothetical protein BSL78_05590 [Apostichopus japonicus]|uniref:Uncharacterized protein n=1 Tax=Stichopus japonicus TaxID=307972 RepID=A0A2G8LB86_STIJA|nr:hypothetical protein BSL78_05590 [Apostichopus japonicus]